MELSLQNIAAIGELITVIVVAGSAAWYAFFSQKRSQQATDDDVATKLINNLKLTVDQQEKTIGGLTTKLDTTTKELHQMQGRNTVLEQLFNGSEGSILSFLKEAPKLTLIAEENNALAKETSNDIKSLIASIDRLVTVLAPKSA